MAFLAGVLGLAVVGCGSGESSAMHGAAHDGFSIDGSSTVFPIVNKLGEDFGAENSGLKVDVNKSGTGPGMQKFSRGDVQIATASRPIQPKELEALKKEHVEFIEVPIAYDGVCVILAHSNSFVDKLTPKELQKMWSSVSKVKTWSDVRPNWPAQSINFYGPSEIHGTYEYFTDAVNSKVGDIRKDYQANQDYNVIVNAVASDKNGIGYVGLNYYINNKEKLKVVPIDLGKGGVVPSDTTVQDGRYGLLSRPLFLYINKKALDSDPAIQKFLDFLFSEKGQADIVEAGYVTLPDDAIKTIKDRISARKTGTVFQGVQPGLAISDVLKKESESK